MNRLSVVSTPLLLGLMLGVSARSSRAAEVSTPVPLSGTWKLNKELSDNPTLKMADAMRNAGGPGGGMGGGGRGRGGGGGMGGGGMGGGGGRGGGGGMSGGGGMGGGGGRGGGGGMRGGGSRGPGSGGFAEAEPPLDGEMETANRQGPPPQSDDASSNDGSDQTRRPHMGARGPVASPQFQIEQEGDNLAFRTERNLRLLRTDGEKRTREGEMGKQEIVAKFLKNTLVIETKRSQGGKRKEAYTLREDKKLQIDFDIEGSGRMPGMKFKLVYDAVPPSQPAAQF